MTEESQEIVKQYVYNQRNFIFIKTEIHIYDFHLHLVFLVIPNYVHLLI